MIDTRLNTFLALLEEKNYTNTAKKLYITQPAVTHHIKSLEKEFNIELFKDNKTFELTPAGKLLKEYAEFASNQYSQFLNALSRQTERNLYNIAFTVTAFPSVVEMDLVKHLKTENLGFNFYIYNYDEISKGLQSGKIDFAFIDNSFDSAMFESISLKYEKICIVCAAKGKFLDRQRITREILTSTPIILPSENNGLCKSVLTAISQKNIRLKKSIIMHSNQINSMLELVKLYDGISFLYETIAKKYVTEGEIKIIEMLNFQPTQNIYLLYNRQMFLDSEIMSIIEKMKVSQVN